MAPRKILRSSTSEHRSRSLSPLRPTDTSENVQHTTPVAGPGAPPQLLQEPSLQVTEAAEDRPPPARPRGRVIPDSQENPSDLDFSDDEAKDDLEDDLEAEQVTAGIKDQPSNSSTEEDLEAPQAVLEVGDSQDSFETVDTVIIPGGVKLTTRRNVSRYTKSQYSITVSHLKPSSCFHFEFCKPGAYLCSMSGQRDQMLQNSLSVPSATPSVSERLLLSASTIVPSYTMLSRLTRSFAESAQAGYQLQRTPCSQAPRYRRRHGGRSDPAIHTATH